ncbi:MAG: Hsp20/alpha crystallin family protein [Methanobrevibacter woesei]|uniref:Hsp20/alpha crystallin family protein n=1 Tax=Methanobrevibacter woesei TaxID=190976 RepID=UPI0023EFD93A|nr:Hsp20/alpha crystallin family protein [Methanobrevibacter woesei]MCI7291993.1 Hsp20/alpha crystallin family protein [Methanobrevibacter woesei]
MAEEDIIETTAREKQAETEEEVENETSETSEEETVKDKEQERRERLDEKLKQGKEITDKIAEDITRTVDSFIVNMKSMQKNVDGKINDYKKTAVNGLYADLVEDEEKYYLRAWVPGIPKKEIEIEASDNELVIEVEFDSLADSIESEDKKVIINGLKTGKCTKTIHFEENIDIETIDAKANKGVLNIIVNKIQAPKQKVNVE